MKDLTQGSITGHLLGMALFIGTGLLFQTAYFLIDLYFVAGLGKQALAGVSAAGTSSFLILALTQIIAVGSLSLIAQATGRKDQAAAELLYNQGLSLALAAAALTLLLGYSLGVAAFSSLAADPGSAADARTYFIWFLPSLACQFPLAALGSAARAIGIVKPTMATQTATVALNALLAPVLISGVGTGLPLGVAGAGLASSISVALGLALVFHILPRVQKFLHVRPQLMKPDLDQWRRICGIGLPAAGEFALMFLIMNVVYYVIRGFGAEAQAGFGLGMRIMQSIFLPAMAVAFAVAPVAGQNYGAGRGDRVRATFLNAMLIGTLLMLSATLLCRWRPSLLVAPFTGEAAVAGVAIGYLTVISWNFVAQGVVLTCSGLFQALGNTRPALWSSASRLFTFAAPSVWLSARPGIALDDFWHLSVASVTLQAVLSFALLRWEFRRKLAPAGNKGFG